LQLLVFQVCVFILIVILILIHYLVAKILKDETIEANTSQQLAFDTEKLQNGTYILQFQTESGLRQRQQLMVVK